MSNKSTIYVLYNAKASVLGKVSYAYKKISAPSGSSPCSACDLTHGGLHLDETAEWKETKKQIDAHVEQLHTDELSDELNDFIKTNNVPFPVILGRAAGPHSPLKLLVSAEALREVKGDHKAFLLLLATRAEKEGVPLIIHEKPTTLPPALPTAPAQ